MIVNIFLNTSNNIKIFQIAKYGGLCGLPAKFLNAPIDLVATIA